MTVGEVLTRMSSSEISEWNLLFQIEAQEAQMNSLGSE